MTKKCGIDTNLAILGFRDVKIENITEFLEQFRNDDIAPIQFFNAKHIAGPQHLYFAAINAKNAFQKMTNISETLVIESLLYASGQRQIKKAVKMLGIQNTSDIAVLIMARSKIEKDNLIQYVIDRISGKRDDNILELTDKKIDVIKKIFQISDQELEATVKKKGLEKEALSDLVIEYMALLVTKS
jgi:KEOPS complex subunit Cgi121